MNVYQAYLLVVAVPFEDETPARPKESFPKKMMHQAIWWTPRLIVVTLGGLYGLGIAYKLRIMRFFTDLATDFIYDHFGAIQVGLWVPYIHFYVGVGVRIGSGFAAGILYDLVTRTSSLIVHLNRKT